MANLKIENLVKKFGQNKAVDQLSLKAEGAELIALLGPSGCGKTTLLRMIAGFESVTSGRIYVDGKEITKIPPEHRNTGMVFQSYALFPHMTVAKNVAFGLEMRKMPAATIQKKVSEALQLVQLELFGERMPRELSGGQQQRVALARALVINPDIFLLDEPLSNLDAKLRQSVGLEIRDLQKRLGLTTLFVTHDQNEALMMADRIVVMRDGAIVQSGSADELYKSPTSRFVAEFLGQSNIFTGKIAAHGFHTDKGLKVTCQTQRATSQAETVLAVRPENTVVGEPASQLSNNYEGQVKQITYLGSTSMVEIALPCGENVLAHIHNRQGQAPALTRGENIKVGWHHDACQLLANDTAI